MTGQGDICVNLVGGRVAGLRGMRRADIESFVAYWHDGGADLEHLGIDPLKLGTRGETQRRFEQMLSRPPPRPVLGFTITLEDTSVGFININVFGRDQGTPHFHLTDPSARRAGVMSAVLRAGLPQILEAVHQDSAASGLLVEIRTRNTGMNAVMRHLGHPIIVTRDLDSPDGLAERGSFNIYEIPYPGPSSTAHT